MRVKISEYLRYAPHLPDEFLRALSGAIIHGLSLYEAVPREKIADVTYEEEFKNKLEPDKRIIKMAKKEHVKAFFEKGTLRLGTFEDYRIHENKEVADHEEGYNILIGKNSKQTVTFPKIRTG